MSIITIMLNRSSLLRRHIPILLGFSVLVALVNLPLVTHIGTHIAGRTFEDALEVLWQLSWMEKVVFETHVNPFYTPDIFYPQGWYLASGAQPSWYFLLLAPLTHGLGVVTTYNLTLLGAFVLAGFGIYALTYSLTRRRLPGIIAGCVYISAPVFTLRLSGHTHIAFGMMFLPYAVLCFYRVFHHTQWQWRWIILAGLMLALTILSLWYFLFIATLPLIGFAFFVPASISGQERMKRLVMIGLVTILISLPFAGLTWNARQEMFPTGGDFSLAGSDALGLSLNYLVVPNLNHPLWGNWSREHFPVKGEQNAVSVGYTALVLAVLGIVFVKEKPQRAFLAMGTVALILALGSTLQWNNAQVTLPAAPPIAGILQRFYADIPLPPGRMAIPLPGLFLYHWLPFYASMRVWARFTIPWLLALAVLTGYGANYLLSKNRSWRYGLAVLGLLVIFEGLIAPYRDFTDIFKGYRAVDRWLAEQPAATTLIEYPRPYVDKNAMFNQSLHGKRVVNGYMSIEPDYLRAVTPQLGAWPVNPAALPILRDWGVHYVIVSGSVGKAEFQNTILPQIDALDGLCHVKTFDGGFMSFDQTHVYKVLSVAETCTN